MIYEKRLVVRGLPDETLRKLKIRAIEHGLSLSDEVVKILVGVANAPVKRS